MENIQVQNDVFHVGITMAGAISAGCYTAGVMDYLFEILELWEQAKSGKLPEGWDQDMLNYIPKHKVIIDAMGGASAGGMTTMMSAIYALKGKITPVNNPSDPSSKKGNMLYDSWVLMGDTEDIPEKIFEKALSADDLNNGKIISLLNSDFIDKICDNAFADDVEEKKLPAYVSSELEVLLSQTMLRSVPLPIDFSTPFGRLKKNADLPQYNTFEHFVISHFKLDYDKSNPLHKDFYLPLAPFSDEKDVVDRLKLTTKATGAFPIGLRFREFFKNEFTVDYIKNNSRKLLYNKIQPENIPADLPIEFKNVSDPFNFIGVDGGAINNEPIGEVLNILKERHGEKQNADDPDKFALIMIDPFPDHIYSHEYTQPDDIFSVIPSILGTLQDQARIKRKEMLDFHTGKYFTGEIFPTRYNKENKKEEHPIACSSVYAFGGFLDLSFRHHDFFLGRDNARNFFKIYFSIEYDPENNNVHPIHKNWTPEMIHLFKIEKKRMGKVFLPVIPDLYLLKEKMEDPKAPNPFERTFNKWPTYNPETLLKLSPKIEYRVKKMIDLVYEKLTDQKVDSQHPITEEIIKKHYKENVFTRISGWIGNTVLIAFFKMKKASIARKASKMAIEYILKDLEDKKLLK
ncbi:hypothetical protein [Chryseobacterium populi]|uniref:PNPLA domain-containing protein n=1 Tax=Chryseobacterium populi TaxID=1144316 RepID=J2K4J9_9FLAO|nr:hypothetical protein [Chryseobacterium populi]EJL75095.1 hypothetical protein PMI13_00569 [Chryseobacterium populi]